MTWLHWLVLTGTMEFWMTFHSVGHVIIPTDELIFFTGVGILPTSHHSSFNSHNFRNSCGFQSEFLELQWAAICHSCPSCLKIGEQNTTLSYLVMFYQFSGPDDFEIHGISYVFHCFPTCSRSKSAFFRSLRWRGLWGFTIQILCSKTGRDAEGVQKGFFLNNQSYH